MIGRSGRRPKDGSPRRKSQKTLHEFSNSFGWVSPAFSEDLVHEKSPSNVRDGNASSQSGNSRAIMKRPLLIPKGKVTDVPWTEKFLPTSKDELAVHPKKIKEVEDWLRENLNRNQNEAAQGASVLLLTGPAGSGKTATVKALANELQFEVNEFSCRAFESCSNVLYVDGVRQQSNAFTDATSQSQTVVFNNFLLRANRYSPLFATHSSRVVLVEEFPNVFLRDAALFHSTLRSFCKTAKCPIVFIVSDSTVGVSVESHLFPKNVQQELKVKQINFNPVAPTVLLKALTKVASVMNCRNEGLDSVAADSMGDIRSAINALQFMTSGSSCNSTKSCTPKRPAKRNTSSQDKRCHTSERDSSIFLFHALGKILHCKRDTMKTSDKDQLPVHLSHCARLPLMAVPEEVIGKTAVSSENLAMFLHENYLAFPSDMEAAADCAASFSQADTVSIEWSGKDVLQDYTALLATRGLMFNLNVSGSHSRWETLHKPQCYAILKNNRDLSMSLKHAFKETRLSLKELETEFIPYLHKLRTPLKDIEQSRLVAEIGQIAVKRFPSSRYESLSTKEIVCDSNTQEDFSLTLQGRDNISDLPTEVDEEVAIEESDFEDF